MPVTESQPDGFSLRADPEDRPRREARGRGTAGQGGGKQGGGKAPPRKPAGERAQRKAPRKRRGWLGKTVMWLLTLGIWASVGLAAVLLYFAADLPDIGEATQVTRRPSLTFLSADGETIATYGEIYGDPVTVAEVPRWLPQAIIATEDRRFYSHFGVDPLGLIRAAIVNLRAGRVVQGGSTLTQQLAKNLFLTPERSMKRKIQELLMAFWLERIFTKDQILSLYLNRVYLGAGTYGFDAAARRYFEVSARKVSLYRSALLAGLLKAPTRYNPLNNPDLARKRTAVVLAAMVDAGYISEAQAAEAKSEGWGGLRRITPGGRYFADWLYERVEDYSGSAGRDLVVETTLDMGLQRKVEAEVTALLDGPGAKVNAGQAAVLVLSPEGEIRAMVGGKEYGDSQFNRATQALRQPGSAFKPFVYMAALEAGMTPDDPVLDASLKIGKWAPGNFDDKFLGNISLRTAVAKSVNTVAVRVSEQVGRKKVIAMARRFGITAELPNDASIALGTGEVTLIELTAAYAALANGGEGVWAHGIHRIRGSNGAILFERRGGGPGRLIAGRTLSGIHDMLSDVIESGTGHNAALGRPAAGKTGTTSDYKDAWFVGYTADVVAGVWLGNDNGAPMRKVTGGSLPAELWKKVMLAAHEGKPPRALPGGGAAPAAWTAQPAAAPRPAPPGPEPAYPGQPRYGDDGVWESLVKSLTGR